ncbi:MAG TPA: T9SS type A sorting domain-containing protein [Flavitalea sp.]|nr:T9SS type A sorting domain-containing protein [Flavitalea sp.]
MSTSAINSSGSYHWLDEKVAAGNLYYRIRAIEEDGKFLLSETVMVNISKQSSVIKVFPNPVKNKRLNISADMLEKGSYTLELTNTLGAVFIHLVIDHPGGLFKQNIHLDKMPLQGIYYLRFRSDKMKFSQSVMVE